MYQQLQMQDFVKRNQFSEILYYLICFGTLSLSELKYPCKYGDDYVDIQKMQKLHLEGSRVWQPQETPCSCGAKLCLHLQIIGLVFKLAVEKKSMITLGRVNESK